MKLVRYLLFPFALLYDLITSARNFFFDIGIFKSASFDFPVIAVGNLSVGGTGKTPQIEYLIRLLEDKKIAVLSRGYKRKTSGFIIVNDTHTAEDVGDEPLQFFKKFPYIPVAVGANRVRGIRQLREELQSEIILLDDAYQHRKVKAGYYILLTKYGDLYIDDVILPTGNLRESRRGARRADLILVTKCPANLSLEEQEKIRREINPKNHQKVFFTSISYANHLKGDAPVSLDELIQYEVVLVTGIANPTPLLDFLDAKKISYQHLKFPDHHHFSRSDIVKIHETFTAITDKQKLILTTEKDYMRLLGSIAKLSYIEIRTIFLNDKDAFDKAVKHFVR